MAEPLLGADMRHHAKFYQNRPNARRDVTIYQFFQNGSRPPSWICWVPIGSTRDDHLIVSILLPSLVKIDAVVSITRNFQYFARSAWKRLFTLQKGVFGVFHLQNEEQYQ